VKTRKKYVIKVCPSAATKIRSLPKVQSTPEQSYYSEKGEEIGREKGASFWPMGYRNMFLCFSVILTDCERAQRASGEWKDPEEFGIAKPYQGVLSTTFLQLPRVFAAGSSPLAVGSWLLSEVSGFNSSDSESALICVDPR
jgi:hypothetical protein